MTLAIVTIVAPLDRRNLAEAEAAIDALGNPPRDDIREALDGQSGTDGTHYCSLHAIQSKEVGKAYLLFEFSADGGDSEAIARLASAIGPNLATIFSLASDWKKNTDIGDYLLAHKIRNGLGLFSSPGLAFAGTPGMSVGRIRAEARLALKVVDLLKQQSGHMWAMDRVEAVRDLLRDDIEFADMLETGTAAPPHAPLDLLPLVFRLAGSFCATYLWPVCLVVLALGLAGGLSNGWIDWKTGFGATVGGFIMGALKWSIVSGSIAIVLLVVALAVGYSELRGLERRDSLEERTADPETLAAMFRRENHYSQNHMISITARKPGVIRAFTSRLVFWVIGELAKFLYSPGLLSDIGTIHFARWVTVPGTRDLVFLSNYDGSWESYLEDFITKAHAGLTGVWSNTVGFPRSENLFQKGATDGERFKRYARQSMIPTRFWYSAYPTLTTNTIRTNAAIRLGLSGAMTEDEASSWLALFGSAARPPGQLVKSEIQSIIFGGLRFMCCGACFFYDLPDNVAGARAWLTAVLPRISFDEGRRLKQDALATMSLALGAGGLKRLGLSDEGLNTFPYAFLTGLTDDARARILGDVGNNAFSNWRWGKTPPQAVVLVYGKSDRDVAELADTLQVDAVTHGARLAHRVTLKAITDDKKEPFGFADGISQPLIRGTYKGLKAADPIQLVEPGEFILGYPDNRGNTPPGPTLPATADPRNILPLVDATGDFSRNFVDGARDLGRNGSFLVIRELEQHVSKFKDYCATEAARLRDFLPEPYNITPEYIGAKLVGRWQNGSSLVRHPYRPSKGHGRNDVGPFGTPATPRADASTMERPSTDSASRIERPARPSHVQDNDFLFGTEDPEALHCPFGAHVRRANPRDSLSPGSQDQIDISNRHRILRIGRHYVPQSGGDPGLLFMCLNGDLERQFEFVQQAWLNNPSFHGLSGEQDPVLGSGDAGTCGFTIATRYGPMRLSAVPSMVSTRGGGYFFLPGKRLLDFLAVPP